MRKIKVIGWMLGCWAVAACGAAQERWSIRPDGSICWCVGAAESHADHIEMSGEQLSVVLRYGVDSTGGFRLSRSVVFPMLRTVPDDTHASLTLRFGYDVASQLVVNDGPLRDERVDSLLLDGRLTVVSRFRVGPSRAFPWHGDGAVELTRRFFPSPVLPAFCERYTVKNISERPVSVLVPDGTQQYETDPGQGMKGSYTIRIATDGSRFAWLAPGETLSFGVSLQGFDRDGSAREIDVAAQEEARRAFVAEVGSKLRFESPDPVLDRAFAFAKIRASESIYRTAGGLMHGPGGEAYYAAVWANDQAEYVNPFFPYLGYGRGNESALNAFRHFARYTNADYRPVPSSIIAEGRGYWNGAGDRGDAAMIAYGAARYALTRGDRAEAEELWPLIEWCLEYCKRRLNGAGVVTSDSDELEGRFPAGDANLCTSALYYDALVSAALLGTELGFPEAQAVYYRAAAEEVRAAIERYFGATVEGFDTYRYYAGNDRLRSWICMPLTVGIFDRREATVAALFSPRLWTENGLLTESGSTTFWDRSTLYALRGVLAAGATETGVDYLHRYAVRRLLGDHVPYPIEAWPEGEQRHLSAESGLFCRIVTEGVFGIRPTGFRSFDITPRLPQAWNRMALYAMAGFGGAADLVVERMEGDRLRLTVVRDGKTVLKKRFRSGETLSVRLPR